MSRLALPLHKFASLQSELAQLPEPRHSKKTPKNLQRCFLYEKYSNLQMQALNETIFESLSSQGYCSVELAKTISTLLTSTVLVDHPAYGELLSDIAMNHFLFSKNQLADFVEIVCNRYESLVSDLSRMQVLILFRNALDATECASLMLRLLHGSRAKNLPVAELIWELHHMLRRNEIQDELAVRVRHELALS